MWGVIGIALFLAWVFWALHASEKEHCNSYKREQHHKALRELKEFEIEYEERWGRPLNPVKKEGDKERNKA